MKTFLLQIFTWWNQQTIGTRFFTWRKGVHVGEDQNGNKYYKEYKGEKRWVTYADEAEASNVPPEWYAWLHKIVDTPPSEEEYTAKDWQKAAKPNMTGTPYAYRPSGSVLKPQQARPSATGDYEAWQPE